MNLALTTVHTLRCATGHLNTFTFRPVVNAFKIIRQLDAVRAEGRYGPSWAPRDVISVTKYRSAADSSMSSRGELARPLVVKSHMGQKVTKANNVEPDATVKITRIYPKLELEFLKQGMLPPK